MTTHLEKQRDKILTSDIIIIKAFLTIFRTKKITLKKHLLYLMR